MDNAENTGRNYIESDTEQPTGTETANEAGGTERPQYDETIKYLFSSEKQALIKLINKTFGTAYDPDTTMLIELKTEFINPISNSEESTGGEFRFKKIIADIMISLDGDIYHIEIETDGDQSIAIRIIGYGFGYAMSAIRNKDFDEDIIVELPNPILIQIDRSDKLPDIIPIQLKVSGSNDSLSYNITVLKLWNYTIDRLLNDELYLLLPFALMRYRKRAGTPEDIEELKASIRQIRESITRLYEEGQISAYLATNLMDATSKIARIINAIYSNNQEIGREVETMETTRTLMAQQIAELSRNEGRAEGRTEGITVGITVGRNEGRAVGRDEGRTEVMHIIKLHMQQRTPYEIAERLGISVADVESTLVEVGMLDN